MSLIKITQKDILKSKPPSSGWHLGVIENFTSEESKDKKSQNWIFDLSIVSEGENQGRYGYARFNSKAPGMLVSSGFLPAALDIPADQCEAMELNPSDLFGKQLYFEVKDDVYEGKIQKKVINFAPASKPPF